MADTASLIARVKTEGAAQAAKELDNVAKSAGSADDAVGKIPKATEGASKGLGNLRYAAANVGYQVQDMTVQLQAGTSAFTVIAQQGSQLASAFGPMGAIVGTVIALSAAIGGVLYKSMGDATTSAEELKDATNAVNDALQVNADGAFEVSDALVDMAANGASAAEIQNVLEKATIGVNTQLKEQYKALVAANTATQKLTTSQSILAAFAGQGMQGTDNQIAQQQLLAKNLGLTAGGFEDLAAKQEAFRKAQESGTRAEQKATLASLAAFTARYKGVSKGLEELNRKTQDAVTVQRESFQQFEVLDKGQAAAEQRKAERDKKAQDRLDAQARREQAASERAAKRDAAAAARAQRADDIQKKAADDFINTLQRQNSDELAAIDAQEQQKLEKLQSFRDNETVTQQQFEDAKTQIVLDADNQRNELLQKQTEDRMKKQNSADSFIEQLQAQNEGELAEIDRQQEIKMQKLNDFYAQGLIAESDYQKARQDIQDEADKKRLDSYTSTLSDTTSALKTSLGEGNALYKAAAITETIINTYKAATGAFSSLAGIPIVGPVLGAAAAAAAVAAGLANVGKIRSAREQGGYLAAGQASTIAERRAEVIVPASASRVRTAQQMRQIMGENGGSNSMPSVTIVNQTSGRIDSVQQERDDEGRLRLIIREEMVNQTSDSNSQFTKARRATRNQPGFQ